MQAVVYDRNGANYCGRLWWMLKWAGHDAVAVLDGGLQAWLAAGGATESGTAPARAPGRFELKPELRRWVGTQDVARHLGQPTQTLIDARGARATAATWSRWTRSPATSPARSTAPSATTWADGRFAVRAAARRVRRPAGRARPAGVVHHCGSGVSTVPNIIAMELAGYPPVALYAGSWSEWSRTPGLPVAKG
jgi:thiosulfate/3-mercaptopyruvate sulfurtransferase